jgi:putative OPT family oligopeptide transporter
MNEAIPAAAEPQEDYELPLAGFKGTPEEIDRQWFEQVYKRRGANTAQLTWRAVLMGSALGGILSLTNIYIGLKAGWLMGVAITACILSYAIWTSLYSLGIVKTKMGILENNCMQSTASSAGYSTGGTLVSAFAAYIMINQQSLPLPLMLGWVFLLAVLGVTMAIPMKRQMINVEQLRFPSGIAAAETLRALHSRGPKGARAAKALCLAGVLAALNDFWTEGLHFISQKWEDSYSLGALVDKFNGKVFGKIWMGRTVLFNWDPVFIAAGVISGLRVGSSMMLGGTLCWAVFVPILQARGVIAGNTYRDIVAWTVWGGVSCMVTSGLLSFLLQWRAIVRAMQDLGLMFKRGGPRDEMQAIETPMSWFFAGQLFSLIGLVALARVTFLMPWWQSTIAVLLTFFLALVACRVTGETDTTPMGPMGKVTQLIFGALSPGNMNVNLMAASITSGAAGASADLLTDLKSGYLLGANPRKQFLAQFAGIFVGTVMTVLAFRLMVSDPSVLGTKFAAPAAQAWRAVALALSKGLAALEPVKIWSIAIGGALGILLPLLAMWFPKQQKYIPSASGLGLAWTFQWYFSLLFFLGSLVGWAYAKMSPKNAEEFTLPIASGVIAGGALMGVVVVFGDRAREALPHLWQSWFH